MHEVVMLLSNAFKPDPRVLKEAEVLQRKGFNLTILCWDRQSELAAEETLSSGVKIVRIQNISSTYGIGIRQLLRIPKFWLAVQRHLQRLKPIILHCHDFDTLPAGLWFGKIRKIPVIYDAHEYYAELVKPRLRGLLGWLVIRSIKYFEQLGARLSDAIVTVDQTLAAIYRKYNQNVVILGHFPEIKMALQSNPVFTHPVLTLLYAGRLSADRGILIYADIVRKLLEKGIPARLILAGVFTPDSDRSAFYDYAKDILDYVKYLGWISYEHISEIYHTADIGLAVLMPEPRYVAATPVKLFEYMASGLPVVASNFPSIADIVTDANCGFLVDPLSSLVEVFTSIEYWWYNRAVPQTLGENGRKAILSKYNWEKNANSLISLYNELV